MEEQEQTINQEQELIEKKKFLRRYKNNKYCIMRLEEKLQDLNIRINSCGGMSFDGQPKSTLKYTKEDMVIAAIEIEERIKRLKARGHVYKSNVYNVIDQIENSLYVEILELLYIDCLSLDKAANRKRYSQSRFNALYRKALDSIDMTWIKSNSN